MSSLLLHFLLAKKCLRMVDCIAPQLDSGAGHDICLPNPVPYYKGRFGGFVLGNFCAWLQDRPLVYRKDTLGQSMIDLVYMVAAARMPEAENLPEVLIYFDKIGYLDFQNNISYATASLQFAEHFQIQNLYRAAYLCCVHLSTDLHLKPFDHAEFQFITSKSRSLLEASVSTLTLHLNSSIQTLEAILFGNDLWVTFAQVPASLRQGVQDFRAKLKDHYLYSLGSARSRNIIETIQQDVSALYQFLAADSPGDKEQLHVVAEVENCLRLFEANHGYIRTTLSIARPLLPLAKASRLNLGALRRSHRRLQSVTYLLDATNLEEARITSNQLVLWYSNLEKQAVYSGRHRWVDMVHMRLSHWIVIYAIYTSSIEALPPESSPLGWEK